MEINADMLDERIDNEIQEIYENTWNLIEDSMDNIEYDFDIDDDDILLDGIRAEFIERLKKKLFSI